MRIRELKKLMAQLSTGGSAWKVATTLADVDHGVPPVFDLADPSTWGPKISPEITVTATEMMIVEIASYWEILENGGIWSVGLLDNGRFVKNFDGGVTNVTAMTYASGPAWGGNSLRMSGTGISMVRLDEADPLAFMVRDGSPIEVFLPPGEHKLALGVPSEEDSNAATIPLAAGFGVRTRNVKLGVNVVG
jgi:hypothetical protein